MFGSPSRPRLFLFCRFLYFACSNLDAVPNGTTFRSREVQSVAPNQRTSGVRVGLSPSTSHVSSSPSPSLPSSPSFSDPFVPDYLALLSCGPRHAHPPRPSHQRPRPSITESPVRLPCLGLACGPNCPNTKTCSRLQIPGTFAKKHPRTARHRPAQLARSRGRS